MQFWTIGTRTGRTGRMRSRCGMAGALLLAGGMAAGIARPAVSAAGDYLEDARTARGFRLVTPRVPLSECLQALSGAAGMTLDAAPELAGEPLVAAVPRRPLRETMAALEQLFDARWARLPGAGAGFRLQPDPAKLAALRTARENYLKRVQQEVDRQCAETVKEARAAQSVPSSRRSTLVLGLLLWNSLAPAQRRSVTLGQTVTVQVAKADEALLIRFLSDTQDRDRRAVAAPLFVTFDLDDRGPRDLPIDDARPTIRARVTSHGANQVAGQVGVIDFLTLAALPKAAEPAPLFPDAPPFPDEVGASGRFDGSRDEQIEKFALGCGLPVLSRHRARGGSGESLLAGGRKPGEVLLQLAASCDAVASTTPRGFALLRSQTEWVDNLGFPPQAIVREYVRQQPAKGQALSLEAVTPLIRLNPLQLSVLTRSNQCTDAAEFVRSAGALIRFRQALSPSQRQALESEAGLGASELTPLQLHHLLDERSRRGDWDVYNQMSRVDNLRLRWKPRAGEPRPGMLLQVLREGKQIVSNELELPVPEDEDLPSAAQK